MKRFGIGLVVVGGLGVGTCLLLCQSTGCQKLKGEAVRPGPTMGLADAVPVTIPGENGFEKCLRHRGRLPNLDLNSQGSWLLGDVLELCNVNYFERDGGVGGPMIAVDDDGRRATVTVTQVSPDDCVKTCADRLASVALYELKFGDVQLCDRKYTPGPSESCADGGLNNLNGRAIMVEGY